MHLGRIVEYADKETLFRRRLHPYTVVLRSAVPISDPEVKRPERFAGRRAEPGQPAAGLRFSYPLSLCHGALQGRSAKARGDRAR